MDFSAPAPKLAVFAPALPQLQNGLPCQQAEHEEYEEDCDGDEEQDFRHPRRRSRDAGEAEKPGYDRNDKEKQSPFQHVQSPCLISIGLPLKSDRKRKGRNFVPEGGSVGAEENCRERLATLADPVGAALALW
jgi:hypothetical protein